MTSMVPGGDGVPNDSGGAHKITQILADSLRYDFGQYARQRTRVVDAGHGYVNGLTDTRVALSWFGPEESSCGMTSSRTGTSVRGICDAMDGRRLGRLAGTSYAGLCAEPG